MKKASNKLYILFFLSTFSILRCENIEVAQNDSFNSAGEPKITWMDRVTSSWFAKHFRIAKKNIVDSFNAGNKNLLRWKDQIARSITPPKESFSPKSFDFNAHNEPIAPVEPSFENKVTDLNNAKSDVITSLPFKDQARSQLEATHNHLFFKSMRLQSTLESILSDPDTAMSMQDRLTQIEPYLQKLSANQVAKLLTDVVFNRMGTNRTNGAQAFKNMAAAVQEVLPSTYFVTIVHDGKVADNASKDENSNSVAGTIASYRFEIFDLSDFKYHLKSSPEENLKRLCRDQGKTYNPSLIDAFTEYVDKRYQSPQIDLKAQKKIQAHLFAHKLNKEFNDPKTKNQAVAAYILGTPDLTKNDVNSFVDLYIPRHRAADYIKYYVENIGKFTQTIDPKEIADFVERIAKSPDSDFLLSFAKSILSNDKNDGIPLAAVDRAIMLTEVTKQQQLIIDPNAVKKPVIINPIYSGKVSRLR